MTIFKLGLLGAAAMTLAGCVVVDERAASVPVADVSPPTAMMAEEARAIVEVRNDDFERLFAAGETMELASDLYTIDGRIVPPDAPGLLHRLLVVWPWRLDPRYGRAAGAGFVCATHDAAGTTLPHTLWRCLP